MLPASEAVWAGTVKISSVPFDPAVKIGGGRRGNGFDAVHLQVYHAAAFRTYKMIMGRGVGIKMICAVPHVQPSDFPVLGQEG